MTNKNKIDEYNNALRWVCDNGYPKLAKLLLDNGADVDAKDCYGNTPLIYACYRGETAIVKLLLENGADVKARDQNGFDVQMIAKDNEYTEIVELLQQYKDDYNTALIWACNNGEIAVVKRLLDKGADVNATNFCGSTVLTLACRSGKTAIVELLQQYTR